MKSFALAFAAITCLALVPMLADAQTCHDCNQSLVQQIVQPQYHVQQVVSPIVQRVRVQQVQVQPVYQVQQIQRVQAVIQPHYQHVQQIQQVQRVQVQRIVQPVVVQQRAAVSVNVRSGGLFGSRANIVVR